MKSLSDINTELFNKEKQSPKPFSKKTMDDILNSACEQKMILLLGAFFENNPDYEDYSTISHQTKNFCDILYTVSLFNSEKKEEKLRHCEDVYYAELSNGTDERKVLFNDDGKLIADISVGTFDDLCHDDPVALHDWICLDIVELRKVMGEAFKDRIDDYKALPHPFKMITWDGFDKQTRMAIVKADGKDKLKS